MVLLSQYSGAVDSISPESQGFAIQGGKAVLPLYLLEKDLGDPPTAEDIQDAITQILGTVDTTPGDGRLSRTLPLAHPQYPWLYASAITSIKGIGASALTDANATLEVQPLPNFALYLNYEFTIEFTPRPYVLAQDASIPLQEDQTFYDEDGDEQTTVYAPEYLRYCWWQMLPQFDNITCNLGFMKFRTQSGDTPGNGVQYAGQPRLFLPNSVLKIYWQCVPYRFITSANSYIAHYIGYLNQTDFTTWKAGTLQYLSYSAKPYTPPVQELDSQFMGAAGSIYSAEKWCDIEFTFLRTTRVGTDVPASLSNKNWIAAGLNLQPWNTTRKFYYASTEDPTNSSDATKQYPLWPSIPLQLLFTDCDADGAYKIPT